MTSRSQSSPSAAVLHLVAAARPARSDSVRNSRPSSTPPYPLSFTSTSEPLFAFDSDGAQW